ncbi:MAG: PAS domain-containing protein, partial [Gemmatimonadales bacterium]
MLTGSLDFVVIGGPRAEDALRRACQGIGLQTQITAAPDPDAAAEVLAPSTDAVICLSDPRPDALARLLTARPDVPVYLVAELPAATEARFLGAGVRAVISPDRLDRLPVEIVRELDRRARHEAVEIRHRSTDERLTKLAEHVRGILYELNETTLRYEYVGPLAEAIIGHRAEELSSPEFRRARIHPADLPAYDDHYHRKARSGLGGQTTYRMVGANGKVVWLQDSVSRHRRAD